MAVKSVKKFFLEIFWTIANLKLIFVTCRSVSVKTFFFSITTKTWLAVLSSSYWLHDWMPLVFIIFFSFLDIIL